MSTQQEISVWVGNQLPAKEQPKEILLVLLLVDDSSSIAASCNTGAVIEGYNGFVEALRAAPGEVRIGTMFLNTRTELSFQSPAHVSFLSEETYRPRENTPLFARSVEALIAVLAEAKRLALAGSIVRSMTFIFTDGGDNDSGRIGAADVKTIVDVMLTTGTHIVGGCAVSDGSTNFWQVFASMGIPEHWIRVLASGHEIRGSMADMGTMASRASTDLGTFTQTSQTGFDPPKRDKEK